jgi:SAM-dependent methyltransferase
MALTRPSAATRYTYDFVTAALPGDARHILEIGCGDGALAALLQADGLDVVAIDSDPQSVDLAKTSGVDARLLEWPCSIGTAFDAVLFTRSLHHIEALGDAVLAAKQALKPGGRLIVEDFRAEGGDDAGYHWFAERSRALIEQGALDATLDELLEKVEPGGHDLHSSSAIAAALREVGSVGATDAAYYFRYLEQHLRRPAQADELLAEELSLIAAGSIGPLGNRFVGTVD